MTQNEARSAEDPPLFLDDLQAGARYRTGGRTVSEADVVNFAGLSGDFHALHMDETFAAGTVHKGRIAHGMLVVAMTAGLVARLRVMRGLERTTLGLAGIDGLRFLKPTFIGDTITVELEVVEARPSQSKPDRGTLVMRRSVRNQRDEVVLEGLWTLIVQRRDRAAA